ncbi:hypothetical protein [Pedobacter aquatilis]|uniref:hypothetical protein n=1 Tax=Pedobacter aquatilis TaxID=351343 RepID=UPI0029318873|nr:hypothetical protein [Pedobacter aquatilis]
MLQSYSWSAFLLLMGGLSILWYAGVALTAYRKECLSFFKFSRGAPEPGLTHPKTVETKSIERTEKMATPLSIMGKSRETQGLESSSLGELSFTSDSNEGVGLKSDIIAELKEIFTLLADNDGDKGDFLGLLEAMKLRYPPLAAHPARSQINSFIKSHAPFLLSMEELENLWD